MIGWMVAVAVGSADEGGLRWTRKVEPEIPVEMRNLPMANQACDVRVTVDERGRVVPVGASGCSARLAEAASEAAARWRAESAALDGREGVVGATLTFRFHLAGAPRDPGPGTRGGGLATSMTPLVNRNALNFLDMPLPAWPDDVGADASPWCRVMVELGADGVARAAEASECDPRLQDATEEAAMRWRVSPWFRAGRAEALRTLVWVRVGEAPPASELADEVVWQRSPAPSWPARLKAGEDVTCRGDVVVNELGYVVRVNVLDCSGPLAASMVDAVLRWRAEPRVVDGEPQAATARVAVTFHSRSGALGE